MWKISLLSTGRWLPILNVFNCILKKNITEEFWFRQSEVHDICLGFFYLRILIKVLFFFCRKVFYVFPLTQLVEPDWSVSLSFDPTKGTPSSPNRHRKYKSSVNVYNITHFVDNRSTYTEPSVATVGVTVLWKLNVPCEYWCKSVNTIDLLSELSTGNLIIPSHTEWT